MSEHDDLRDTAGTGAPPSAPGSPDAASASAVGEGAEPGDGGAPQRRIAPYAALAAAAVLAVLFVILAGARGQQNAESAETPLIGRPAPSIVGPTLDGSTFDLARRRGSWVVLNFFQSTCVPCIQEHPEVVAFAAQQAELEDGAELVTVVFDDRPARIEEFFAANGGGNWPVVLDGVGASTDYGVSKVPETWLIDPDGRVVWRTISTITADKLGARIQEFRTAFATVGG